MEPAIPLLTSNLLCLHDREEFFGKDFSRVNILARSWTSIRDNRASPDAVVNGFR
jgi:hypothetical protein